MKKLLSLLVIVGALPAAAQFVPGGQMSAQFAGQYGQQQMMPGGQMGMQQQVAGNAQMMTVPAPQTMGNPSNQAQMNREGQVPDDQAPYNAGCGGQLRPINRDGFVIEGGGSGSHN